MINPNQSEDDKDIAFEGFASDLVNVEKKDKKAKKNILREGIKKIEKQEKDTINRSRVITSSLSSLREIADMSPFVGTSGKITSPRIKRGEFIELLAREILHIGREEIKDKGGIISLHHLRNYFSERRENWELREKDIPEALEWLDQEDLIPELDKLTNEKMLVFFRPVELSIDTKMILEAATGISATRNDLVSILGWDQTRLEIALSQLSKDGIAILDNDDIYFPGI